MFNKNSNTKQEFEWRLPKFCQSGEILPHLIIVEVVHNGLLRIVQFSHNSAA